MISIYHAQYYLFYWRTTWEKKLAYKINRSNTGFYVLFDLELDGKSIVTMTKTMNLDKNLFRFMFVKKD